MALFDLWHRERTSAVSLTREQEADPSLYGIACVYFASFIVIGAFMFTNIIVGVTVTNLQTVCRGLVSARHGHGEW